MNPPAMLYKNREGLEHVACECYGTVRDQFRRTASSNCLLQTNTHVNVD
jgi:hypothetical protein